MTTDPLCPQQHTHPKHDPNRCIFCEYGGAVREDERQRVTSDFAEYRRHMEEWQAGYSKGHAAGVEQGQRDEHAKWSVLIKDRIRDLQSCTKHDDCMGKADILLVILDDYDYANGVTDE